MLELLNGKDPRMIGLVLSECTATWLATFHIIPDLAERARNQERILDLFIESVRGRTPEIYEESEKLRQGRH
jgi:hypothetical protein